MVYRIDFWKFYMDIQKLSHISQLYICFSSYIVLYLAEIYHALYRRSFHSFVYPPEPFVRRNMELSNFHW
jgi:hypothetical protein